MRQISKKSYTIERKIRKDSKGKYIMFNNRKIRFNKSLDIIETPYKLDKKYYIQDYRAFDGHDVGKSMTLQITRLKC